VYPQSKHWVIVYSNPNIGGCVPPVPQWSTPLMSTLLQLYCQVGRKASVLCDWHWYHSSTRLTPSSLLVAHSHAILTASTTQATDSNWVRELKMPPAEQIHRLDPGQRADKDPLNTANNFLATGPSLWILQLNVEGLSTAKWTTISSLAEDDINICTQQQHLHLLQIWCVSITRWRYFQEDMQMLLTGHWPCHK